MAPPTWCFVMCARACARARARAAGGCVVALKKGSSESEIQNVLTLLHLSNGDVCCVRREPHRKLKMKC
jgi:hypothetical protein